MISQGPEIELEDSKVLFSVISSIFDIHLFSLTVLSIFGFTGVADCWNAR